MTQEIDNTDVAAFERLVEATVRRVCPGALEIALPPYIEKLIDTLPVRRRVSAFNAIFELLKISITERIVKDFAGMAQSTPLPDGAEARFSEALRENMPALLENLVPITIEEQFPKIFSVLRIETTRGAFDFSEKEIVLLVVLCCVIWIVIAAL